MLPEEVLMQARDELLDWHGIGMSVMEISHRGEAFKTIVDESMRDLRDLLHIPDNYQILFLQGGARLQFSMVPMNLLNGAKSAVYIDTGYWSQYAIEEAKIYCDVQIAATSKAANYTSIADFNTWKLPKDSAYLYYTDNETISGVEFPYIPETNLMLVSDMSSNFLSRPFDVSRFGLVFACAQKNVGPAGLTVVIIRDDLLRTVPLAMTPSMLRYALHAKDNSLWNTPPTFAWYMAGLTFKWLKAKGGVEAIAKINEKKANKLYQFIDSSDFYKNSVAPRYRSRMNVPFSIAMPDLDKTFLQEAEKNGLTNLKGHRLVGGMRASIYNAMPEAGIDALIAFMKAFEKRHG
jgi:phosphoserine aminotransferase